MSEFPPPASPAPLVVNLGRQSRKRIKRLQKGDGPLAKQIQAHLDALQLAGEIPAGAHPVIFMVERTLKKKKKKKAKKPPKVKPVEGIAPVIPPEAPITPPPPTGPLI